jgi:hypothetical protein
VPITLLYGCCQIETCAHDLAATRRFMMDALGAVPVEQPLAREIAQIIPDPNYDVDHLECGEAVFQVNQPSPSMTYNGQPSIHQRYLDRVGPCVTNLNFYIDDHLHAHELLTRMGANTHIRGPSSAARSLADYGPDNTRPGADERSFLFMGSRDLIGFDLEIMEPNFLRFAEQQVQFPAFVQPRPATGSSNLSLKRLIVAIEALEHTFQQVTALFAPASRSRPYDYREDGTGRAIRISLGGIEIEYLQPLSGSGPAAEALAAFGAGVVAIEFAARDFPAAIERAGRFAEIEAMDRRGEVAYQLQCRELTGFDAILTPQSSNAFGRGNRT